jgi:hypothetical protein
LRQTQFFRRPGEVQFLSHGNKVPQMTQFHSATSA